MSYDLRPRGVGQLVDATFRLYRTHWWTLIKTMGVLVLPFSILLAGLQTLQAGISSSLQAAPDLSSVAAALGSLVLLSGGAILYYLAISIANAAITAETAGIVLEGEANFRGGWKAIQGKLGRVLGAVLLALATRGGGFLCCCVGYLVIEVFLAAFLPIVMIEGLPVGQAFGRSFNLVKPGFWRVVGVTIVIWLIVLIPMIVIGAISAVAAGSQVRDFAQSYALTGGRLPMLTTFLLNLAQYLVSLLISPLYAIGQTLVYFDLRIRQEGFDLERAAVGNGLAGEGGTGEPPQV